MRATSRFAAAAILVLAAAACGEGGRASNACVASTESVGVGSLVAVDAASPDDVWAVGGAPPEAPTRAPILHFDGEDWSEVGHPPAGTVLGAVEARSPTDVWVLGDSILRFDGDEWTTFEVPEPANGATDTIPVSIAATGPDDAWVVGQTITPEGTTEALVMHWDGRGWREFPTPATDAQWSSELLTVGFASPSHGWALGSRSGPEEPGRDDRGLAMEWNGHAWNVVETPPDGITRFDDIATGPSEQWAGGDAGVERRTVAGWETVEMERPRDAPVTGVGAASADDAWAVTSWAGDGGYSASVHHWDGAAWSQVGGLRRGPIYLDVAATGGGAWAVGGTEGGETVIERICTPG
jgi:hypothetical protein